MNNKLDLQRHTQLNTNHNTRSNNKRNKQILWGTLVILSIVIALVLQQRYDQQDILGMMQAAESRTAAYTQIEGAYPAYALTDEAGNILHYAVFTTASGYGGLLEVLTLVNQQGIVEYVDIIKQIETPLYINKVLKNGYPEILTGYAADAVLRDSEDIVLVSGATITSEAIILAVEKAMYQVGETQLGWAVPELPGYRFQSQDGLVIVLLLMAVIASVFRLRKLRPWLLIAAVISIGFVSNASLSIGNFVSIIGNRMPVWAERPMWYILVIGVLVSTIMFGKNIYCRMLCPFGAAQGGIYRGLHLVEYKPEVRVLQTARKLRWLFVWIAVVLALTFNNPGIASYEPFAVFFSGDGNIAQWLMMAIILLLSIGIMGFWCRYFCPVGAILDFVAKIRSIFSGIFKGSDRQLRQSSRHSGGQCGGQQINRSPRSFTDTMVLLAVVTIYALIAIALIQNIQMGAF